MSKAVAIRQSDATRYLKAASAAGFERARLIIRPDGTIEMVAEHAGEGGIEEVVEVSALDQWRRGRGQS